ncbi:LPS-assembly protein LptD [Edaphobacter bradus]|uniref:LPS-assembly protein LptD n=1 Tax=Edaphobacter bradus TaxID=2259016 RepID=UPI0021DF9C60|nr:LPS assembly protein LptD [Edaphobacter bradus]
MRFTTFEPEPNRGSFLLPQGLISRKARTRTSLSFRAVYFLITITLVQASHPQSRLIAQEVPSQATQASPAPTALPDVPDPAASLERYPEAVVLPDTEGTTLVSIVSDRQSKTGNRYALDGNAVITYKDRRIEADHIDYDSSTEELNAAGHLKATGGENHEIIRASHGTMNLKQQTGRFYDVTGSVGLKDSEHRVIYSNGNPFLFAGRLVVKTGPQQYEIYDGSVTSCQLPNPDWQLFAGRFSVDGDKATARNSVFRVINMPVLYLPYVSHPVDTTERQSGFLIPVIGDTSTKGIVLGEQIYWAINRSTDLTVGAEYFSRRGWQQSATFRYRGLGNNFATAHYNGLLDRGYYTGGKYVNQGGEDVVFSGRYDFSDQTRVAADLEYLSSFAYREAFSENFNQAVSSDILSIGYATHEADGYSVSLRADRYQGLKQVATATLPEGEIHIFHAPSLDLATTDHPIGGSHLLWSADGSLAGLKRVQPNFSTTGLTGRFDLHPQLALPLGADGWRFMPSIGVRETIYTRGRHTPYTSPIPVETVSAVNRADLELQMDVRAPVLERTFSSPLVHRLFGSDVKHTIQPEVTYRYVTGVDNFPNILRFDDSDIVSNTNEVQYGVVQRIFVRQRKKAGACAASEGNALAMPAAPGYDTSYEAPSAPCRNRELISWKVTQKYFFDPTFGGAVVAKRRNIFQTTLDLSGIAFLTEPRNISPLISRLRLQPSDKFDLEWDFDVDTGARKFTSNNVLIDFHEGNVFSGFSYARLNAPGRFYTQPFGSSQGTSSPVSDFNQVRLLLGYGAPTRKGLGVAANVGLDLRLSTVQYGALQTSWNWDCCGFSVEYRKYELGSVRNENAYRFNLTLANIGSAGNLRRAERLF